MYTKVQKGQLLFPCFSCDHNKSCFFLLDPKLFLSIALLSSLLAVAHMINNNNAQTLHITERQQNTAHTKLQPYGSKGVWV